MNRELTLILEDVLQDVTGRSIPVNEDCLFRDLGIDSLTLIEVVLSSEEAFDVEFEQHELTAENIETTGAFLKLVEGKRCKR